MFEAGGACRWLKSAGSHHQLRGGASKSSGGFEITEWMVVADQKSLVYYIRTFDNPDIRSLNLGSLPLNGGKIRTLPLDQPVRITPLSL